MSSTSGYFGMIPAYHNGGGTIRPEQFQITDAYASTIYQGSPISISSNGKIQILSSSSLPLIGCFDGCEYTDVNGQPHVSNRWPASTATATGSTIVAWCYRDPQIIYSIQGNGPISQSGVGNQAGFNSSSTGNNTTGMSTATIDTALLSGTATGQLRVIRISDDVDNTPADNFTKVYVQIAVHQDYPGTLASY